MMHVNCMWFVYPGTVNNLRPGVQVLGAILYTYQYVAQTLAHTAGSYLEHHAKSSLLNCLVQKMASTLVGHRTDVVGRLDVNILNENE